MASAQNVVITNMDTAVTAKAEPGNPTGFDPLTANASGQIKGTDGADKATLADLIADKDHVINLGAGDDVFVFRNNGDGLNSDLNGIVIGGAGTDRVYANGELSDYTFSLREDGTIKIHYTPGGADEAAVSFSGFEFFTFNGIDPSGVNHVDQTFSYNMLRDMILAAA